MLRQAVLMLIAVMIGLSCERPFSYSPFEAAVPENLRNTNSRNIKKILALEPKVNSTFKICIICRPTLSL
jgi:hypothetical protein